MTGHTRVLDGDESAIHALLTDMSARTCDMIATAIRCVAEHDKQLALQVIDADSEINSLQSRVEEQCIITIARHQPVASDLRYIVSDSHISVELERIADHAVDIVKVMTSMESKPDDEHIKILVSMGESCNSMLSRMMTAYAETNAELACEIAAEDKQIDALEQQILTSALARMCDDSHSSELLTRLLWIAHHIERIGDRITNIAERVVYIASGNKLDLNQKNASLSNQ